MHLEELWSIVLVEYHIVPWHGGTTHLPFLSFTTKLNGSETQTETNVAYVDTIKWWKTSFFQNFLLLLINLQKLPYVEYDEELGHEALIVGCNINSKCSVNEESRKHNALMHRLGPAKPTIKMLQYCISKNISRCDCILNTSLNQLLQDSKRRCTRDCFIKSILFVTKPGIAIMVKS